MKKLLNILLLVLLVVSVSPPSVFSQTVLIEGENGWVLLWHPEKGVDSSLTKDYFSCQGSQVFENFGETYKLDSENRIQFIRAKDFSEFSIPDTLVLKIRLLEWNGNLIGKYVSFDFQDSTGGFIGTGINFDLEYDWNFIKFPIKEVFERAGVSMKKIVRIYVYFILISSDPEPTDVSMIVEADYLSLIYGEEEVILDDFGDLVSVPEEKVENGLVLFQNYPNPFNPTTTISYSVPSTAHVTLNVYDVLGQKVVSLVDDEKTAGKYEVNFNASDLPSGTYFYRFQSGNYSQTKKMLLIK